jgi:hypothetical protein
VLDAIRSGASLLATMMKQPSHALFARRSDGLVCRTYSFVVVLKQTLVIAP